MALWCDQPTLDLLTGAAEALPEVLGPEISEAPQGRILVTQEFQLREEFVDSVAENSAQSFPASNVVEITCEFSPPVASKAERFREFLKELFVTCSIESLIRTRTEGIKTQEDREARRYRRGQLKDLEELRARRSLWADSQNL